MDPLSVPLCAIAVVLDTLGSTFLAFPHFLVFSTRTNAFVETSMALTVLLEQFVEHRAMVMVVKFVEELGLMGYIM